MRFRDSSSSASFDKWLSDCLRGHSADVIIFHKGIGRCGTCRRMGAPELSKNGFQNNINNDNQNGDNLPDYIWILPFMMVGAMFGSIAGVGIGYELGYEAVFGPALTGALFGVLAVGLVGWLFSHNVRLN